MRRALLFLVVCACADDPPGGGVSSSSEHVEATLPLPTGACFSQPLLDVQPTVDGLQVECSATLDGDVIPACGSSEPCWEIVAATMPGCTSAPAVRGASAGLLAIDCATVAE